MITDILNGQTEKAMDMEEAMDGDRVTATVKDPETEIAADMVMEKVMAMETDGEKVIADIGIINNLSSIIN